MRDQRLINERNRLRVIEKTPEVIEVNGIKYKRIEDKILFGKKPDKIKRKNNKKKKYAATITYMNRTIKIGDFNTAAEAKKAEIKALAELERME